jgi:hypothetical protein
MISPRNLRRRYMPVRTRWGTVGESWLSLTIFAALSLAEIIYGLLPLPLVLISLDLLGC